MTQPTPYRRGYDFSDAGGAQPPGGPLDDELDDIGLTVSQILRNMALLQRDDAALRNGIVGIDALDSRVLGLISGGTFSIAGTWQTATNYPSGAFLTDDGAIYLVMEAHTSTTIVDDLAAGRIAKALQNEQGTRLRDDFIGNAVQTAYSLSQSPARPTDIEVYVDGALVLPDDYIQTGATVTFDVAPANGAKISIFSITWATAPPIQTLVDAVGDRNTEISAATQFLADVGDGAPSKGASLIATEGLGDVQSDLDARPTTAALASPTGGEMVGVAGGGTAQGYFNGLPKISENLLIEGATLDGAVDDATGLQAVIDGMDKGVISLPGFDSKLAAPIDCKSDQIFDFGRSIIDLSPSGASSFDIGWSGPTQVSDVKFANGYYELHGAAKTGWRIRNAGGTIWDSVNLRMYDDDQIGIHAVGNLSPFGPYYGETRGLRIYGNATPGSGQVAIQLDHSGDIGAISPNRWDMHLRQIAAVDFGLRINGAQGFTSPRASFEACYDTAIQIGCFGGGVNPGYHHGAATTATTNGQIIDTSLIGQPLFTAGAVKFTSGANAGRSFPVVSVILGTGTITLRGTPPFEVEIGDTYTYYEFRAQATLPLVEVETAGTAVAFGAHAGGSRVNFGWLTDAPIIFTREIEDIGNTVARRITPVRFTVTAALGAGDSAVWLEPAHVASNRGGFELIEQGWIEAVSVVDKVLNTGRAGTLKLVTHVSGVPQPDALCPILTDIASTKGRRVRTSLTPAQKINPTQTIKVLAEGTGMAAGSWPEVTVWIGLD